nr:MAG: hypothetical protein [Apis mellifera filamentous virus]
MITRSPDSITARSQLDHSSITARSQLDSMLDFNAFSLYLIRLPPRGPSNSIYQSNCYAFSLYLIRLPPRGPSNSISQFNCYTNT